MFNRKGMFIALMALMLGISTSISAYPLLTFNATDGLAYSSGLGSLRIEGTLTSSLDVTPPTLLNSSVVLTATLASASDTTYAGYTVANFNNANLSIIDGDLAGTTLLDGDLTNLMMYGLTNSDSRQASMVGTFTNFTGSLSSEFVDPADFFALELNLSQLLNSALFYTEGSSLAGDVYGKVSSATVSVPEPGVLLLFGAGLVMLGFTSSRKIIQK